MFTLKDVIDDLSLNMEYKRFMHTLGVIDTAEKLAIYYKENVEDAVWAAALHDCSKVKGIDTHEMFELSKRSLFENSFENENIGEPLLHSAASEVIAREKYGIEDIEILSAVRWHTTGKAEMSRLAMIVYAADMIEPTSCYAGVDKLREAAFDGLEKLCIECGRQTIKFISQQNKYMAPETLEFLDYLSKLTV